MEYDRILQDASIIDEDGLITAKASLCLKDGRIAKLAPELGDADHAPEIIDCRGLWVTPGFVNLHVHSPMNLFKGLAEDVQIHDWFNREIFPYESRLTGDDVYWGALLAIAEMTEYGVTAFADHYFGADQICRAVLDGGIRAEIAPTLFGMAPDFRQQLEESTALIERRQYSHPRLSLRMGPHAPYTCPPETLRQIVDRAKELQVGLHIHVSETAQQVEECRLLYRKTPFAYLHDAGGFELPVLIGHGLWLQDEDLAYLNDQTYLAVCPKTYLKLAMGSGAIWRHSQRLPLAIGTDGAASSNSLNPLEQARLFGLVGKFIAGDAEKYPLEQIWQILMRGHQALPFHSGRLEPGYRADLLIWDLRASLTAPLYNPLAAIIYSAESRQIVHALVGGEFVKKHGKVLLDTGPILEAVQKIQARLLRDGKGRAEVRY
ncbi:5-methylthioadenosine/S-adenosylhomocysteine deaminase [Hydrogenispora ethanolica]|uniref:5-methylthioadenosine/S-adenosylhomocysteine deaminase n=1 Tax=Hydrogenispora ethanolica TaxID=1082276 RepID=A0A4R1RJM5_HYDET|nr:amidohydrolase family protein [Hydrogenispora ethanolica]TCL65892.1 5-methylthioadenosine/S-adenosylhomocysteine deaminase [Hydrogenispora ethanolica]